MEKNKRMYRGLGVTFGVAMLAVGCGTTNKTTSQATLTTTPDGKTSGAESGAQAKQWKNALVRFAQADPATGSSALYFGDLKIFSDVAFKTVTPYLPVPAERHEFKLGLGGDGAAAVAAKDSEGLSAGKHYTVLSMTDQDGKHTLAKLSDDLTAPAAGKAKIRVINAVPTNVGDVDVFQGENKLFFGIAMASASAYKEVDPTMVHMEVHRKDNKSIVLKTKDVELAAGRFYTILVMGDKQGRLDSLNVEDQLLPPQ